MEWVTELLQNNVPNFSIPQCMAIFQNNVVCLHEYLLITVGRITLDGQDRKQVAFLRILGNVEGHKPLQGIHLIELYRNETEVTQCWIYSFSALRKKLLYFEDHVSFERSTFLIYFPQKKLIRLKCLRSLLQLPTYPPNIVAVQTIHGGPEISFQSISSQQPTPNSELENRTGLEVGVSARTMSQFAKHLEQIYTSYVRDLCHVIPKKEIIQLLKKDIEKFLFELERMV